MYIFPRFYDLAHFFPNHISTLPFGIIDYTYDLFTPIAYLPMKVPSKSVLPFQKLAGTNGQTDNVLLVTLYTSTYI